jgi:hypothetical protein
VHESLLGCRAVETCQGPICMLFVVGGKATSVHMQMTTIDMTKLDTRMQRSGVMVVADPCLGGKISLTIRFGCTLSTEHAKYRFRSYLTCSIYVCSLLALSTASRAALLAAACLLTDGGDEQGKNAQWGASLPLALVL